MAAEAMIFPLILFFILLILAVVILAFIFWIWMIVDCAKRQFKNDNDKVIWILIIVLLQILGAIIYYFAVKLSDKKKKEL
jgi:prolipoprotein diacylglyceryltransferase